MHRSRPLRRLLLPCFLTTAVAMCRDAVTPHKTVVNTETTVFVPARIEIAVGDSVEWRFGDPHNVILDSIPGAPASILESGKGRYVRVFTVAGQFPYRCTLHAGMTGEVSVR